MFVHPLPCIHERCPGFVCAIHAETEFSDRLDVVVAEAFEASAVANHQAFYGRGTSGKIRHRRTVTLLYVVFDRLHPVTRALVSTSAEMASVALTSWAVVFRVIIVSLHNAFDARMRPAGVVNEAFLAVVDREAFAARQESDPRLLVDFTTRSALAAPMVLGALHLQRLRHYCGHAIAEVLTIFHRNRQDLRCQQLQVLYPIGQATRYG